MLPCFVLPDANDGSGDPKAADGSHIPVCRICSNIFCRRCTSPAWCGWKKDETPTAAQGLKIKALATGLATSALALCASERRHPGRGVRRRRRPHRQAAEGIRHEAGSNWWATSGGNTGEQPDHACCAIPNGDGVPDTPKRLPRSSQLAVRRRPGRQRSLCRQHRCDRALSRTWTGDTKITAPGTTLTPLPGGPIDHHWTKSLVASPDGTLLYVGVGSNSNITENGMDAELDRADDPGSRPRHRARFASSRAACAIPTGLQLEPQSGTLWAVVNERDELGPDLVPDYMTSVKDGALLRLALQLLRPARRSRA